MALREYQCASHDGQADEGTLESVEKDDNGAAASELDHEKEAAVAAADNIQDKEAATILWSRVGEDNDHTSDESTAFRDTPQLLYGTWGVEDSGRTIQGTATAALFPLVVILASDNSCTS